MSSSCCFQLGVAGAWLVQPCGVKSGRGLWRLHFCYRFKGLFKWQWGAQKFVVAPRRSYVRLELKSNMLNYRAGRSRLLWARDGISALLSLPLCHFVLSPPTASATFIGAANTTTSFSLILAHSSQNYNFFNFGIVVNSVVCLQAQGRSEVFSLENTLDLNVWKACRNLKTVMYYFLSTSMPVIADLLFLVKHLIS